MCNAAGACNVLGARMSGARNVPATAMAVQEASDMATSTTNSCSTLATCCRVSRVRGYVAEARDRGYRRALDGAGRHGERWDGAGRHVDARQETGRWGEPSSPSVKLAINVFWLHVCTRGSVLNAFYGESSCTQASLGRKQPVSAPSSPLSRGNPNT